jgi:serine/threonine-protein kinase HipA
MKKVDIFLKHSKSDLKKVGSLANIEKNIYFEYDQKFLADSFEISPLMLPKKSGVLTLKTLTHLQGLWGVFQDSLPDGWGLLLMDRYFRKKRIGLQDVSLLDRLLFIGDRGSGALVYSPAVELKNENIQVDLDYINLESQKILSGNKEEVIPELLRMGGSPGGARPKIFVGLNSQNEIISGTEDLPINYEHWIIKFNSRLDNEDFGAVEFAYSQMAAIAGVRMSETKLIVTNDNKRFFATKRFDRQSDSRFHLHSFAHLIGADFRLPSTDYLDIMKASYTLTRSHIDLERILRVMIFNIMTHNRDDHAKNFSFIMNHQGEWSFAPAYDLTFSHGPGGEHSNTLFGEGKNPTVEHIQKIADEFSIKKSLVVDIINQTSYAISQWEFLCADLEISKKVVKTIGKNLKKEL